MESTEKSGDLIFFRPANVTDAQRAAILDASRSRAHSQEIVSIQSEITAVLTDKPYPGEYMANVDKLHVKGEVDAIVERAPSVCF